ncbi:MAG TPA: glycosyltransferase [Alphaproteobacteria bacterium]|nr:glycosyltransferase [Alphaproteobacteria bacterium]
MARRDNNRVLIYSHDTFGLGHLRRCRTIAHALVDQHKDMSVLILSGSPIIGSFDFKSRVDFVRVPGVIKLRNGQYTSLSLHIDIEETLAMRASIIRHTAEMFDPDLFIVDKEPLGLRGEVKDTLAMLKGRGTPLVLGLRDVMDEPEALIPEWERKNVMPALEDLYDDIWVYGLPEIHDPLEGLEVPAAVRAKLRFTGYLRRTAPSAPLPLSERPEGPYILVTPGGGGDGEALVDWVLRAYEADRSLPWGAMIVTGPFMARERVAEYTARANALPNVELTTFETHLEAMMEGAAAVVAMGGYNTFCEILSFDKPALIVPRIVPRREQYIRAERAQELGLVRMLVDDGIRSTPHMAEALRRLAEQPPPSRHIVPGLLDGLANVDRLAMALIAGEVERVAASA